MSKVLSSMTRQESVQQKSLSIYEAVNDKPIRQQEPVESGLNRMVSLKAGRNRMLQHPPCCFSRRAKLTGTARRLMPSRRTARRTRPENSTWNFPGLSMIRASQANAHNIKIRRHGLASRVRNLAETLGYAYHLRRRRTIDSSPI
jgi:hypothetical protein